MGGLCGGRGLSVVGVITWASVVGVASLTVLWTWPRYISCGGRGLSLFVVGVASLRWACSLCGGRAGRCSTRLLLSSQLLEELSVCPHPSETLTNVV